MTDIGWHSPWTEPVRQKIVPALAVALVASGLFSPPIDLPDQVTTVFSVTTSQRFETTFIYDEFLATDVHQLVVLPDKWFKPLETPVRVPPAVRTGCNPYLFFHPTPIVKIDWFAPLDVPNKLSKPALITAAHPYEFRQPFPIVKIDWFGALAEPVRLKPGLPVTQQQSLIFDPAVFVKAMDWFEWFAEPVRLKPGLSATEQQAFIPGFVPIIPTVTSWHKPFNEPVRFRVFGTHHQQALIFTEAFFQGIVKFWRSYIIT